MQIVIIGNGISGVSCARYIRKLSDHKITIISGETDHFFSRTALMYIYMGHMQYKDTKPYEDHFWSKNRIELMRDWVLNIDYDQKELKLQSNRTISYDKLVIACGSQPNKFGWPGQDLEGVQGLYSYQDLEKLIQKTPDISRAVIVGGGLIGIELAEMLQTRSIPVSFLVREENFWDNVLPEEESKMISRHILDHQIDLQLSTGLKSINDNGSGSVKGVLTSHGESIDCQFVGLTAGVRPNIDWLKNSELETDRGIMVNLYFQTNMHDVYAIGDCAQFREPPKGRRPVEQVWYTGKIHGITAAYNICDHQTPYFPGPWFNSAKFFDIEYQTYGDVPAQLGDNMNTFYWQHPNENIAIRMVWSAEDDRLLGVNSFGIRLRHQIFDNWLREDTHIDIVMNDLSKAAFNPELIKNFIPAIQDHFRSTKRISL